MYEPFKEEIDFILRPEAVTKEKVKNNYDINLGWKLNDIHKVTKKELTSDKKFNEKLKTKDADVISKMVHIDYNDDAKVSDFVNALSLRAGAFNWKLSKQYFIFGLKRGIKDIIVRNAQGLFLAGAGQITTNDDYGLISRAFDKMARKYEETGSMPNLMTVDFKTGKAMSSRSNVILIGLPYDMRIEAKTKEFIDTIWKIENNETKPITIDTSLLQDGPGEIEKMRMAREETTEEIAPNAIVLDQGNSTSSNNQQRALRQMSNEQSMSTHPETFHVDEFEDTDEDEIDEEVELREDRVMNDAISGLRIIGSSNNS